MTNFRYWAAEIWFICIVAVLTCIIGLSIGYVGELLLIVAITYLGWHLRQINRLRVWLTESRNLYPPESIGIWSDIFHNIYLLQKRNRKGRRRLTNILSQFRASTAALPDGAVVLGASGDIVWFNRSAEKLFGLNPKQDIGQRITNLLRDPRFVNFEESGQYDKPVEMVSPIDAKIHLSIRITPYNDSQRLLIARNITQLYMLEKVRQDFVANVSHELRTPLTVVHGYMEIMDDSRETLPTVYHKPIDQMAQQVLRMRSLVDDLLTLSKLDSSKGVGRDKPVSIETLLRNICKEAIALSGDKHKISFKGDCGKKVPGNEKELHSAFSNLVFNAVRYTPEGGSIVMRWYETDDSLVMSVTDTGPGIESQHLPRLTERFYRVDDGRARDIGGTGLGLAIVKHILELHGAELKIESEVGKGSCFSCVFDKSSALM
ncbi:phosphate regulon sensor histidine kinase PhoR [Pleionea sp. CnH1-48]|uniref:phosphate regulon sensor histidine kinase PhoR n=1 Tax=Pleionea sp. CnH1-48 TaxID=2954494 RepID=UPI002096DAC9|nr:phosphate regulon sensor histidine kinase PhoR [Pleionea sp. CnH1-48]MCO7226754.1 phosphate regulon sensor histidine kinase PhoR [Pleionea sp. CnH1-48]